MSSPHQWREMGCLRRPASSWMTLSAPRPCSLLPASRQSPQYAHKRHARVIEPWGPRVDVRRVLSSLSENSYIWKGEKKLFSAQFSVERYIVLIINLFSSSSRPHHRVVLIIESFSSSSSSHHQFNLPSQSTKPIYQANLSSQATLSSHPIKPPYQATLSSHPIKPPYQATL